MEKTILVTGGAGFIGSNFILQWIEQEGTPVVNLDKLTYAGNPNNLLRVASDPRYCFVHGDVCDRELLRKVIKQHKPRAIVHFAAESHVDRSIHGPDDFIRTNVVGTFSLLEEARAYCAELVEPDRRALRLLHVSTDEVYGSLGPNDPPFCETTAYAPNSPYSASKAAADHLVRAYHHTYGLPTLTSNCSNNYGPYQFPEKLIPLTILNARAGKPLPVYGDGQNVRDWLFVEDHCDAIRRVLAQGGVGETYNIGGGGEKRNLEIVETLCSILDQSCPDDPVIPHQRLISFVKDRPGHDRRYAIDARKIERELGWKPRESFEGGIRKTIQWYLQNEDWVKGSSAAVTGSGLPPSIHKFQFASTEQKTDHMRITIFGATGLLGKALMHEWKEDEVFGLSSADGDIRNADQVEQLVRRNRPDWIVLAAAYTNVDGCETNRDLAFNVNCRGAVNIAQAAKLHSARLLFISTDYVFDGKKTTPYTTADPRSPRSVYGQSKAEAEAQLEQILPQCCIVRTSWLFGTDGKCFPDTILKLAATRPRLEVVGDQRGSPTYSADLARAVIQLCRQEATGIVHITNRGECSWYEFAREIIARAGLDTVVCETTSDKFVRPAERPKYSVLSPESLEKRGVAMPDWQDALGRYLADRISPKTT